MVAGIARTRVGITGKTARKTSHLPAIGSELAFHQSAFACRLIMNCHMEKAERQKIIDDTIVEVFRNLAPLSQAYLSEKLLRIERDTVKQIADMNDRLTKAGRVCLDLERRLAKAEALLKKHGKGNP